VIDVSSRSNRPSVVDADQAGQRFQRPVSPVEWWIAAHPAGGTPVLQIAVEGDGRLDPARLAAAVAAAGDACPGTRLTRKGRTWIDTGVAPQVRVVGTAESGPVSVGELAELQEPLSDKRGPTCEVLLVAGERSAVVFRASHAVMDAAGVLIWAGDVFRALRGEPMLGAADPTTEADVLPDLEPGVEPDSPPTLECRSILGARTPGAAHRTFWRRRTIDGYHPGLLAKLAAVVASEAGEPSARFSVPVNLRRHAPEIRSTASVSQSISMNVAVGTPWEETHQELLTMLADKRETRIRLSPGMMKIPVPVLRKINGAVEARSIKTDKYAAHAVLAHLGRFEVADFSAPGFEGTDLYSLSMAPVGGPMEIDVIEYAGHTEIAVNWHDGPGLAERAEQLLDRVEEHLSPLARRKWAGNQTDRPLSADVTVAQLFARQAAKTPDAIAVSGPDGAMTYAELDRRSRIVADAVRSRGLGRDDVVGILADRTATAIAAVWGVIRSGAAYLPMDVQHPDARLSHLLADARATLCLVEKAHAGRAAADGCEMIVLEELPDHAPDDWSEADVAPGDLAYVIYTSGSTGQPKGVEIEHRALHNYVVWTTRDLGVSAATRMPLLASLAFDMSLTPIFVPLLAGGTLVLPTGPVNHATLRDLLLGSDADGLAINGLSLTPTLLELICELDVRPKGIAFVLTAGELLRRATAVKAQAVFGPDCRMVNSYGPTETTIECSIHHPFDPERDTAPGVSMGVPADNCTAHILDGMGRFVADGEAGEIYLGGVQLARGYRGRPDLTRERFVRLADGSRVYRSGDIGRMLPSGSIEFVARIDDQVKILGHRIEPAEISQTLEEHPTVTRAAVVVRSVAGHEHKLLCAYLTGGDDLDPVRLEQHLADRLPPSMVPSTITVVPEIPLTVNGKIDTGRLPDPFAATGSGTPPSAVPSDAVGEAVVAVWAETLGVDAAGLGQDSDFYQLGGNSLLMLSMIAGVCRSVVGPELEPRFLEHLGDIVGEPTVARVADIARAVRAAGAEAASAAEAPTPAGSPAVLPV
jgi:amino acid adenylation domain-containing protein